MAEYKKVCKVCGKEFEPSHKLRAYCSDRCRRVMANRRCAEIYAQKHPQDKEKICAKCGETFLSSSNLTKYCDECRRKNNPVKVKKYCPICGKEVFRSKQAKYCSLTCAWKAKQVQSQRKSKPSLSANGTLCWHCKWACGKDGHCPWASHLVPVEGWEAKKTYLKVGEDAYTDSYIIKDCPLFEEG